VTPGQKARAGLSFKQPLGGHWLELHETRFHRASSPAAARRPPGHTKRPSLLGAGCRELEKRLNMLAEA